MNAFRPPGAEAALGWAEAVDSMLRPLVPAARARPDHGIVICLLFHRLIDRPTPQEFLHEGITAGDFDRIIGELRRRDFTFLKASDLRDDRHLSRRSIVITFDDGYADNLAALPVLERYAAPATFFAAPGMIVRKAPFWPDVLYAAGTELGWSRRRLREVNHRLLPLPFDEVEARLAEAFGTDTFRHPAIARPMTEDELARLAASPLVEIGNHSYDHTTLSDRPLSYLRTQIDRTQAYLAEIAGRPPAAIAYPNGRHDAALTGYCRDAGLSVGFTSRPGVNDLPAYDGSERFMTIRRIAISGHRNIRRQLGTLDMSVSMARALPALKPLRRRARRHSKSLI